MSEESHEFLMRWIDEINRNMKDCFRKIEKNNEADNKARIEILEKINALVQQQSKYQIRKEEFDSLKKMVERIEKFRIQIMVAVPIVSVLLSGIIPYVIKYIFEH